MWHLWCVEHGFVRTGGHKGAMRYLRPAAENIWGGYRIKPYRIYRREDQGLDV